MTARQSKKEAAVAFLRLASAGKAREAFDAHAADGFRHHNAYFRGDADSLRAGMEQNAAQFPNKIFEVQRTLEDGDFVAVHSRVRLAPEMPDVAVVHIFRFSGERIVEMWDVGQQAPADSPNENGVF
jgi:predicted SnoaL-like aldol condensation-catalyzing enzyme